MKMSADFYPPPHNTLILKTITQRSVTVSAIGYW